MSHRISLLLLTFFYSSLTLAQMAEEGSMRYIAVTGSAEVIVQPDEIELEITLQEYDKFSSLAKLEKKFFEILKKNKVADNNLVFGQSEYHWYSWWHYRRNTIKEKTYKVKLDCSTDFLSLVQDLDFKGLHSLRISDTSNKQLQELRREVKISAIRAAKEKAKYLLESIDEKLGKALTIEEVPEANNYWNRHANMMSNVVVSANISGSEFDNVAEIKLRYEVKAKFGIL